MRSEAKNVGEELLDAAVTTCSICGAKRGPGNKWLVLFEAQSARAALIGPIEQAALFGPWIEGGSRFYLCGEGCLYRKLSGVLRPASNGRPTVQHMPAAKNGREPSRRPAEPKPLRTVEAPLPKREAFNSARVAETASIDQGVTINGDVYSQESLYVNGEIVGSLELRNYRLTIGPNGVIRATVRAKEVEILGMVEGDVTADRIVVRKYATMLGDLCTRSLMVEEGARFEGRARRFMGEAPVRVLDKMAALS
jgi:cytoskeletal protein CcmA (bactofilin family)